MPPINQNIANPIAKIYFKSIYKNAVKMAELRPDDTCLDFGCGSQSLRAYIRCKNYIGYDILPEFSDISDYRKTKPTVVFALAVLEHLTDKEIAEFADWLCLAKPRRIVISMPCDYFTNRFFKFITGRDFINDIEHINHWKNTGRILIKKLRLLGYKRVWMMQWISSWEPR